VCQGLGATQVQAVTLEPRVTLHFATQASELETVLEYVNQGNLNQYGDKKLERNPTRISKM
jgi:hypothetical protein